MNWSCSNKMSNIEVQWFEVKQKTVSINVKSYHKKWGSGMLNNIKTQTNSKCLKVSAQHAVMDHLDGSPLWLKWWWIFSLGGLGTKQCLLHTIIMVTKLIFFFSKKDTIVIQCIIHVHQI
jgi:hypothetical protein